MAQVYEFPPPRLRRRFGLRWPTTSSSVGSSVSSTIFSRVSWSSPFLDPSPMPPSSKFFDNFCQVFQDLPCQRSSTFEYEEIQTGYWKFKIGGFDAMCCERLPHDKGVNRICVNVWLLAPPFNIASTQPPSTFLISMVACRTCPPILWSDYNFFPWRCGFAIALCRADADNLFDLRASEHPNCARLLPRYFAFVNH